MGCLTPLILKGQVHPAFGGSTPTPFWKSRLLQLLRKWWGSCQGCWTSIYSFPWTRPLAPNCGPSRLSPSSELGCISSETNHGGWPGVLRWTTSLRTCEPCAGPSCTTSLLLLACNQCLLGGQTQLGKDSGKER